MEDTTFLRLHENVSIVKAIHFKNSVSPWGVFSKTFYLSLASAVIRTVCSRTSTFTTINSLIRFPDFVAGVWKVLFCTRIFACYWDRGSILLVSSAIIEDIRHGRRQVIRNSSMSLGSPDRILLFRFQDASEHYVRGLLTFSPNSVATDSCWDVSSPEENYTFRISHLIARVQELLGSLTSQ
jgi:hypothetical protein